MSSKTSTTAWAADEHGVRDLAFTPALAAAWTPLADISETDDAYLVEVELPGVNKDQVNVNVNDHELVITGEIAEPQEEEGRRRRRARRTGRFEFRTTLPADIDPQGVSASLSDGVLTVRAPKSEAARPRHVEISGNRILTGAVPVELGDTHRDRGGVTGRRQSRRQAVRAAGIAGRRRCRGP